MRSAIRPAAERRGLSRALRRVAALRPGAAAGCTHLRAIFTFTRTFADEAAGCRWLRGRTIRDAACEGTRHAGLRKGEAAARPCFAMTETPHPNTKLRASTARRTRRSRTPPKPAAQTEVRRRRQEACRACGRDLPSAAGGGGERHAHACDFRAAACKARCGRRQKAGLKPKAKL